MVGNKHIDILEAANWTGITVLWTSKPH
jgi:hypothetical protein